MPGGSVRDVGSYNPEAATSKHEIVTVKFQIYQLEERIANLASDAKGAKAQYRLLKQVAYLIYSMFGRLQSPTGREREFAEDLAEIEAIYERIRQDVVPVAPTPRVTPLSFRQGLAQYEVTVGDDYSPVEQCFGPDLQTVLNLLMENESDRYHTEGVGRIMAEWARLHRYMAKYGIWHLETRIPLVETGYDPTKRSENLRRIQDLMATNARAETSKSSNDDE